MSGLFYENFFGLKVLYVGKVILKRTDYVLGSSSVYPSLAILDAIKNPLKTGGVVTDQLGRQSQRFIGQFGEVVVNPQTGKIISVNPTSSNKAAKLIKQLGQ